MDANEVAPELWPSVTCSLCSWEYRAWNEDDDALVMAFVAAWMTHIKSAHPGEADVMIAKYHAFNAHS